MASLFSREGNGNPLQYSCLENPRGGGARWAAVYGVTQSQTRLKQLSSSSLFSNYTFALGVWKRMGWRKKMPQSCQSHESLGISYLPQQSFLLLGRYCLPAPGGLSCR